MPRVRSRKSHRHVKERLAKYEPLLFEGLEPYEIAERLGVHVSTVHRDLVIRQELVSQQQGYSAIAQRHVYLKKLAEEFRRAEEQAAQCGGEQELTCLWAKLRVQIIWNMARVAGVTGINKHLHQHLHVSPEPNEAVPTYNGTVEIIDIDHGFGPDRSDDLLVELVPEGNIIKADASDAPSELRQQK